MHDDELIDEQSETQGWVGWILTALLWGGVVIALHVVLQRAG